MRNAQFNLRIFLYIQQQSIVFLKGSQFCMGSSTKIPKNNCWVMTKFVFGKNTFSHVFSFPLMSDEQNKTEKKNKIRDCWRVNFLCHFLDCDCFSSYRNTIFSFSVKYACFFRRKMWYFPPWTWLEHET